MEANMAEIRLKLLPLMTPNFVRIKLSPVQRADGFVPDANAIPLKDLDPSTLDELCREFRAGVFSKAGKEDPYVSR